MRTSLKLFVVLNVVLSLGLAWIVPRRLPARTDLPPELSEWHTGLSAQADEGSQHSLPPFTTGLEPPVPFSQTKPAPREESPANSPVIMPLVFQNASSDSFAFTDQHLQVFAELRQRFIRDLGEANQAPTEAREKWQAAQQTSDDLLLALLGAEFYLNFQLEASRSSIRNEP